MNISTENIVEHMRSQERRIGVYRAECDHLTSVVKNQDNALNDMYQENVNLARKIDYYRLVTGLLILALAFCAVLLWR